MIGEWTSVSVYSAALTLADWLIDTQQDDALAVLRAIPVAAPSAARPNDIELGALIDAADSFRGAMDVASDAIGRMVDGGRRDPNGP